jgi:menaquinone-specific isochorismate synthase
MSAYSDHDEHILSIAESLHPTPAISGIPSTEAQKLIRSTEPFNRGWYGGLIGWFDTKGNGEFSVAIRSAISDKNKVTLYAGAGVVLNSNPQDEWDEIQLKFQSILNSLI